MYCVGCWCRVSGVVGVSESLSIVLGVSVIVLGGAVSVGNERGVDLSVTFIVRV